MQNIVYMHFLCANVFLLFMHRKKKKTSNKFVHHAGHKTTVEKYKFQHIQNTRQAQAIHVYMHFFKLI